MLSEIVVKASCVTLYPLPDIRRLRLQRCRAVLGDAQRLNSDIARQVTLLTTRPKDAGALSARLQQCQCHVADLIFCRSVGLAEAQCTPRCGSDVRNTVRRARHGGLIARWLCGLLRLRLRLAPGQQR